MAGGSVVTTPEQDADIRAGLSRPRPVDNNNGGQMKIKANKVAAMLKHSGQIVQKRKHGQRDIALPFATAVLMAKGGMLIVLLQRRGLSVSRATEFNHESPWVAVVDAQTLSQAVRQFGTRAVSLRPTAQGGVSISDEAAVIKVGCGGQAPEQVWAAGPSSRITVGTEAFRDALRRAASAASTNPHRADLTAVQFKVGVGPSGEPALELVGTDGHRLVAESISVADISPPKVFYVGSTDCRLIAKLLPAAGQTQVHIMGDHVFLQTEGVLSVWCAQAHVNFLDWQKALSLGDLSASAVIECGTADLIRAFAHAGVAATGVAHVVRFHITSTGGQVTAKATRGKGGVGCKALVGGKSRGSATIGVNYRLMVETLRQLPKGCAVKVTVHGSLDPICIESSEVPELLAVVMPARLG